MLCLLIFINIFSFLSKSVFNLWSTYYFSYLSYIIFFLFLVLNKCTISLKEMVFLLIIIFSTLLSSFCGTFSYADIFSDFHRAIFVYLAYFTVMVLSIDIKLKSKDVFHIFNFIIALCILSSAYALITQLDYVINILNSIDVHFNSWFFRSFFFTRNIFAGFCLISVIAAVYNYFFSKKKVYIFISLFFITEIILTTSRASLVCVIFFVLLAWRGVYKSKTKIMMAAILCFLLLLASVYFTFFSDLSFNNHLSHNTELGIDSGKIRTLLWRSSIIDLMDNTLLLFGLGKGAIERLLMPIYGLGSSHNIYIDMLYENGIIYFMVMLHVAVVSIKKILRADDKLFKSVMLSLWATMLLYGVFEATFIPFYANYLSILVTIMLIVIPKYYISTKQVKLI